jgi:hypothetical protein
MSVLGPRGLTDVHSQIACPASDRLGYGCFVSDAWREMDRLLNRHDVAAGLFVWLFVVAIWVAFGVVHEAEGTGRDAR